MCSVVRRDVSYFSRSLMGSARQGAPVDLFVVAAPPWCYPSLFVEDGHLRAAAVGASDEEVKKLLDNYRACGNIVGTRNESVIK